MIDYIKKLYNVPVIHHNYKFKSLSTGNLATGPLWYNFVTQLRQLHITLTYDTNANTRRKCTKCEAKQNPKTNKKSSLHYENDIWNLKHQISICTNMRSSKPNLKMYYIMIYIIELQKNSDYTIQKDRDNMRAIISMIYYAN